MKAHEISFVEPGRTAFATIRPDVAAKVLFVSTYETTDPLSNAGNLHGYQRPPMQKRFKEIAKHFTTGDNRFKITPLIISVRLNSEKDIEAMMEMLAAGDADAIVARFGHQALSVVDGQHRAYGLIEAWKNDPTFSPSIPMLLFFGMSFVEEAELFNVINVTQRKLPKALIETTRGDITEADQVGYAQQIRRIAFGLCRDGDSVWGPIDGEEQINMTGVRDPNRPVTYEGLRRSTANMFPKTLLDRLTAIDPALPLAIAKRYWRAVSEACNDAWFNDPATKEEEDPVTGELREVKIRYRIKDLVGVASLAKLGHDIIKTHIDTPMNPNRLEELTLHLSEVDWEKREDNPWMRSQAGFAGQKELYELLYQLVYRPCEVVITPEATASLA